MDKDQVYCEHFDPEAIPDFDTIPPSFPNPYHIKYWSDMTGEFRIDEYWSDVSKYFEVFAQIEILPEDRV